MQAALYHAFKGPIRIETIPIPPVPRDGVLLRVMATGVCRSDWHGYMGHDSDIRDHGLPFCPGHEVSGIVVDVGPDCRQFHRDDRVAVPFILSCGSCEYCVDDQRPTVCCRQQQPGFTQFGSFAEYLALPRADRNLRKLPESVSFVQAAALGCRFTTAYRAVVQQGLCRSDTSVCVVGVGGLGLSCVMIAASVGAKQIIAVDISPAALDKARELGATHTVVADDMTVENVLGLTHGQGVRLSIDAAGIASSCENAIHCTRRGGRMVQVGLPIGDGSPPKVPMGLVAGRELELVGSHGASAETISELLKLVAGKKFDPSRIVEKEVSLQDGVQVLQHMDQASPLGMTMITSFPGPTSRL